MKRSPFSRLARSRLAYPRLVTPVLLALMILPAALLAEEPAAAGTLQPRGVLEEPTPDLELPDLDGNLVSLRSFPGKIVVFDFWAVWCGPCVDSLPFFQGLEDRYGDQGLVVVGLHVDDNVPSVEEVQTYLNDRGVNYVNLLSTVEADEAFRIFAMPTTYITDRDGIVRTRHIGFNPARTPDRLEKEVRDLLGLE